MLRTPWFWTRPCCVGYITRGSRSALTLITGTRQQVRAASPVAARIMIRITGQILPAQVVTRQHKRGDNGWVNKEKSERRKTTIQVSLVEDDLEVRNGLAALISRSEGLALAGAYASFEDAIASFERAP